MINLKFLQNKLPVVGVLGSHSALEVCYGACQEGLSNIVICQKGRDKTYSTYYKKQILGGNVYGCVDEVVLLDNFVDILQDRAQDELLSKGVVFVPHRSFEVYVCQNDYSVLKDRFKLPIFGNRYLLEAEERTVAHNQYALLQKAQIKHPKQFAKPSQIDRLVIVKVSEATRRYERGFFFARNPDDFMETAEQLIAANKITEQALKKAVIEEFIIGPTINLNFFYSPIYNRLELIGTDTRRQTNIDGYNNLTASQQLELQKQGILPNFEEAGHIAATLIESMIDQAFEIGYRFVQTCQQEFKDGIIGPFALQCAIKAGPPKKEFVVYDVSLRMPGSPGIKFTPYSEYLFGRPVSMGQRVAMEIKRAHELGCMEKILT